MASKMSKQQIRRERRLLQNRKSACKLRNKKKQTFQSLTSDNKKLESEYLNLKKEVEHAQEELLESMSETLMLRKRLDQLQQSQNAMMMDALKQRNQSKDSPVLSRKSSGSYNSVESQHTTESNVCQQAMPLNNFVLEAQTFNFMTALKFVMSQVQQPQCSSFLKLKQPTAFSGYSQDLLNACGLRNLSMTQPMGHASDLLCKLATGSRPEPNSAYRYVQEFHSN
uniref:BZIP domain-containing protein n=1 Tax=Euplotes harpa TaxID=151035 RepID=A0A7S3J6L4_9SPIT|mmetsp:Transcript_20113/g.23297  ORF Transcript_20113/g.23297 Transcript_20113/m.23297 type:complete len:225 (+) Transcript_20113:234-908(+)